MEEGGKRRFEMAVCLGRGGFGEVYKATMHSAGGLASEVAVKILHRDLHPAGQAVQRLRDEGRLLARLNHPAILRVHDLVLLDGSVCLVTEYIEGEDLAVCIEQGAMPPRAVLEAVGQVAGALDMAWNAPGPEGPLRLVHRDIKPSNIRISRHGQVKLLDFGIARSDAVSREARTQTNLMMGSPAYMAPERFTVRGNRPESDIFALGCCLYEGLAGGRRFLADLDMPLLTGLASDPDRYAEHLGEQLEALPGDTPQALRTFLGGLLAREPEARPTAAEVVRRCEALAEEVGGPTLARWCRERDWSQPGGEQGKLQGQVITEGTLASSGPVSPLPQKRSDPASTWAEEAPPEAPRRRGRGLLWVALLVVLLAVGTGAVVLALGVVAGGVFFAQSAAEAEAALVAAEVARSEAEAEAVRQGATPQPDESPYTFGLQSYATWEEAHGDLRVRVRYFSSPHGEGRLAAIRSCGTHGEGAWDGEVYVLALPAGVEGCLGFGIEHQGRTWRMGEHRLPAHDAPSTWRVTPTWGAAGAFLGFKLSRDGAHPPEVWVGRTLFVEVLAARELRAARGRVAEALIASYEGAIWEGPAMQEREQSVVFAHSRFRDEAGQVAEYVPGGATVEPLTWESPARLVVAVGRSAAE